MGGEPQHSARPLCPPRGNAQPGQPKRAARRKGGLAFAGQRFAARCRRAGGIPLGRGRAFGGIDGVGAGRLFRLGGNARFGPGAGSRRGSGLRLWAGLRKSAGLCGGSRGSTGGGGGAALRHFTGERRRTGVRCFTGKRRCLGGGLRAGLGRGSGGAVGGAVEQLHKGVLLHLLCGKGNTGVVFAGGGAELQAEIAVFHTAARRQADPAARGGFGVYGGGGITVLHSASFQAAHKAPCKAGGAYRPQVHAVLYRAGAAARYAARPKRGFVLAGKGGDRAKVARVCKGALVAAHKAARLGRALYGQVAFAAFDEALVEACHGARGPAAQHRPGLAQKQVAHGAIGADHAKKPGMIHVRRKNVQVVDHKAAAVEAALEGVFGGADGGHGDPGHIQRRAHLVMDAQGAGPAAGALGQVDQLLGRVDDIGLGLGAAARGIAGFKHLGQAGGKGGNGAHTGGAQHNAHRQPGRRRAGADPVLLRTHTEHVLFACFGQFFLELAIPVHCFILLFFIPAGS